ncbi:MAG TPA: hypothetical protein VGJ87_21420 [Roseiflexaceae bacterium]
MPKPFEPIRQFRPAGATVRQLADKQRERLDVSGDTQGACIHRLESRVADKLSGDIFGGRVVPAVDETWSAASTLCFVHTEQHFAGHSIESDHNVGFRDFPLELLGARCGVADDEVGVVVVHGTRARHGHLA